MLFHRERPSSPGHSESLVGCLFSAEFGRELCTLYGSAECWISFTQHKASVAAGKITRYMAKSPSHSASL